MTGQNINDALREALAYMKFDNVPSMKELNTKYRRMALEKHPDKNNGSEASTEDYKNLLKFYKLIGEHIVDNVSDNVNNDEEESNISIFKQFNFDQKNKYCHTIHIERKHCQFWDTVLRKTYGEPEDKTETYNGLVFKVNEFCVEDETHSTITVTLHESIKKNTPNIHIQNKSQYVNDEYVLKELPKLYDEVRKMSNNGIVGVGAGVGAGGRTFRDRAAKQSVKEVTMAANRTSRAFQYCKEAACRVAGFNSKKALDNHTKTAHFTSFDKRRNISLEKIDEEIEVAEVAEVDTNGDDSEPTSNLQIRDENKQLKQSIEKLQEKVKALEKYKRNVAKEMESKDSDRSKIKMELDRLTKRLRKKMKNSTENMKTLLVL